MFDLMKTTYGELKYLNEDTVELYSVQIDFVSGVEIVVDVLSSIQAEQLIVPLVEPDQLVDIVIGLVEHSLAGPVFEADLSLVARKNGL